MQRRNFLKAAAAITAAGAVQGCTSGVGKAGKGIFINRMTGDGQARLQMKFRPYVVELRHTFTISGYSRDTTTVILIEVSYDGVTGYGEAALPPYMTGQNLETATAFLSKVNLGQFSNPFELDDILSYIDGIEPGMSCAKCGLDIALNDLVGKLIGLPLYRIWGYTPEKTPCTSFTIGMDSEEVIRQKTLEAAPYKILKVKLGASDAQDRMIISTIRSVTDKPLVVDANQGWQSKEYALDMICWLKEQGVQFVEQPMRKDLIDDTAWITERSPLPVIADESCQRLTDIPRLYGAFSGINIKLIKCTGLREANKMIAMAGGYGMKIMVGCTTETSCAISAAAQITPKVDFADIDGNLLITNDCFDGMKLTDGKITLNDRPGIGVIKK